MRHSLTRIRAWTMPRLSRSADDLLPEYVGRMSLPMSSMTASSCPYLLTDGIAGGMISWCCCIWCFCATAIAAAMWLAAAAFATAAAAAALAAAAAFDVAWPCRAWCKDEEWCECWGSGGVLRRSMISERGVPGLLTRGVADLELLLLPRSVGSCELKPRKKYIYIWLFVQLIEITNLCKLGLLTQHIYDSFTYHL